MPTCTRGRILLAVLAFASIGAATASAGSPPATIFIATSGSDANACTAAAPCLTMNRAYRLAAPGAVVELAGGSYPAQRLTYDATKVGVSADVTFRAASGALAALAGLALDGAQHVVIVGDSPNSNLTRLGPLQKPVDGITLRPDPTLMDTGGDLTLSNCADNNSFIGLDMRQFGVSGSDNTLIDGGSAGGYDNVGGDSYVGPPYLMRGTPTCVGHNPLNTHITHLVFHDVLRTNLLSAHPDCLQFYGSNGVLVDYNSFARCGTSNIMDRPSYAGSVEDNQVFDHNLLGPLVEGGNTIVAGATTDVMGNVTISNNVCARTCVSTMGASFASLTVTGNWWGYMVSYGCAQDLAKASLFSGNSFAPGQYLCGSQSGTLSIQADPFPDAQAPSAPGALSVDASQASSVDVSWAPSTDNLGVVAYDVYLDGVLATSVTTLATTVDGLSWGSHTITVAARDAADNTSPLTTRAIASSWQ
jgi:hypothetical protein